MYVLTLLGSIVILFYFLTLAGTILESKLLLPDALAPILDAFQYVYNLLFSALTELFVFLFSFF